MSFAEVGERGQDDAFTFVPFLFVEDRLMKHDGDAAAFDGFGQVFLTRGGLVVHTYLLLDLFDFIELLV